MKQFATIYQRAVRRKGGEQALKKLIAVPISSSTALAKLGGDRFLAEMTRSIFQAGFVWRVIENKWPEFEKAFWQFNIERCRMMSPDDEESLLKNAGIVRNLQKIRTVPQNAQMIHNAAEAHGSFARMVADWPGSEFVELLFYLKKHGARLGGNSAQYFLRRLGKDGFVLSADGIWALIDAGVIDRAPSSRTALLAVQQAFNEWSQQSGLGLAQISRVLACSIDAPAAA